jgi:hypothetical protein
VELVEMPLIYCPFPPVMHPRAQQVEREAIDWIRRSGMCATDDECQWVIGTHSVDFFARFAPSATDDRLLATALWVYWGFAFDDARCDVGELASRPDQFAALAGRVQHALEAPSARDGTERFIPALQDIARMFSELGTATQVRRFAAAHRAWLSGVTWQIGNRARGHMPDLDEYLAMRLHSAGGEPTFAMLELATGPEVPAGEFDRPAVRALTEMAITVASLDNDRHSAPKEALRGHADQNIYSVLSHHQGLTYAESVAVATAIRDRVLNRFVQLLDRVRPRAGIELNTYLDGLCHGIRGNAEWGLRVPRYLSTGALPDSYSDAPLEWADAPSDPRATPPPSPSVSWWWDDDLG